MKDTLLLIRIYGVFCVKLLPSGLELGIVSLYVVSILLQSQRASQWQRGFKDYYGSLYDKNNENTRRANSLFSFKFSEGAKSSRERLGNGETYKKKHMDSGLKREQIKTRIGGTA